MAYVNLCLHVPEINMCILYVQSHVLCLVLMVCVLSSFFYCYSSLCLLILLPLSSLLFCTLYNVRRKSMISNHKLKWSLQKVLNVSFVWKFFTEIKKLRKRNFGCIYIYIYMCIALALFSFIYSNYVTFISIWFSSKPLISTSYIYE